MVFLPDDWLFCLSDVDNASTPSTIGGRYNRLTILEEFSFHSRNIKNAQKKKRNLQAFFLEDKKVGIIDNAVFNKVILSVFFKKKLFILNFQNKLTYTTFFYRLLSKDKLLY